MWVHNGHGGKYGWSGPIALTVEDDVTWTGTVRNVKDYGATGNGSTDDASAIQSALDAAGSGGRVYFPTGTYKINSYVNIPSGVWIYGDGQSSTTILRGSSSTGGYSNYTFYFDNQSNIKISDITLDGGTLSTDYGDRFIQQRGTNNVWYTNCKIIARNFVAIDNANGHYQYWTNCEFRQNNVFQNGSQHFITGCNFYGTYDAEDALNFWGVSEASVVDCRFANEDYTVPEGVLVRMLVANFAWGESRFCYFGDNTTDKIGQIEDPLGRVWGDPGYVDQNKGEQLCFEGTGAKYIGSPSSATATTVTFNDNSAPDVEGGARSIMVLNGKGIGQARHITSFSRSGSSITITFTPALNVVPNTQSRVGYGGWWNNIVIYRNNQSGRDDIFDRYTAQCAVQFFGGAYNINIDNNTYNHLRAGIQFWTISENNNWRTTGASYFSLVKDNTFTNVENGAVAAIIHDDGVTYKGTVPIIGILIRNNSIIDNLGGVVNSAIYGSDALCDMLLWEHNSVTNIPNAIGKSSADAKNQLYYKNTLNRGSAPFSGSYGVDFSQGINPAFNGNSYNNFETVYSGTSPEAILEVGYRLFELTSSGSDVTANLNIANVGTSTLTWTASDDANWLTLSSTSDSIIAEGNSNTTITCNPSGLTMGNTYTASITITGSSQTQIVTVQFTVGGESGVAVTGISVSPTTTTINTGATQQLTATVLPTNASNKNVTWSTSNASVATISTSGLVTGVASGNATITVTTVDQGKTATSSIVVTVPPGGCSATGSILAQRWDGISGTAVSNLTSNASYPNSPTSSSNLTSMEIPTNVSDNYGVRIAGYICAPATGSYTFWIAGDDNVELWLSSNSNAANKTRIAYHTSWTNSRQWNRYTTQKSAVINLTQGQSYYVEALMNEGGGDDNLAVGWLKPGQSGTVPSEVVPGSVLSPLGTPVIEYSVFSTQTPASSSNDQPYELGMKFTSTSAGEITKIRYYKMSGETGTHTGRIWSSTGTQLASVNFTGETSSGWQTATLSTALSISANTTYVVSVNSATNYAFTSNAMGSTINNGPLSSIAGSNGVFNTTPGAFPSSSWNNSNYFRDVVFISNSSNSKLVNEMITSSTEISEVNVYPNPTTNKVTIDFTKKMIGMITIHELSGKALMNETIEGQTQHVLDISGLSNGIYILTIDDGSKLKSHKITIDR